MGFWSSLFGANDAQATGDSLDAQLAEMNQRDYAPGGKLYNAIAASDPVQAEKNWAVVKSQGKSGATGTVELGIAGEAILAPAEWIYDPAQAWADTKQGGEIVKNTADEVLPEVKSGVNWIFKSIVGLVPWWVWLALAGYVAWKLGLFDLARRRIAKA